MSEPAPRVVLRPLRRDDAPAIAVLANEEALARMTSSMTYPFTLADAEAWIDRVFAADPSGAARSHAIEVDGAFAGAIGSFRPKHGLEVGYWLGAPFRGRGVATTALRMFLDLLAAAGVRSIAAVVMDDNPASVRVLEGCGFVATGKTRSFSKQRGEEAPSTRFERVLGGDAKSER